jgi:hypothetical protein
MSLDRGLIDFIEWAEGNGYADGLQIDRIDNDIGYCPANCRWVTPSMNSRNRRNSIVILDGEFAGMLLIEAYDRIGSPVNYGIVRRRHALGWTARDAILTPKTNKWNRGRT